MCKSTSNRHSGNFIVLPIQQGFQLEIPSRAASNQIYVPELDRIVLGDKTGTRSFLNVKVCHPCSIDVITNLSLK